MDPFKAVSKFDGRPDRYTYFYIRALRLLNNRGVHVFICSNLWLDVGYGAWLQELFLRRSLLHMVIDNHVWCSFIRAVNKIVITVTSNKFISSRHTLRFLTFKRPFEEALFPENLLAIENVTNTLIIDSFRVFPKTVREL